MKLLRFLAPVLMFAGCLCMHAETPEATTPAKDSPGFLHLRQFGRSVGGFFTSVGHTAGRFANSCDRHGVLNKLELGVTVGTTGLGIELGTPITKWARLRVGASYIPHVALPMHFSLMTYAEGTSINTGNFDKVKDMMYEVSGYEIDDVIDVDAVPKMWNLKVLADIYPIPNNHHWRLTGGVFIGNNTLGTARNTISEAPSLLAMNLYNKMYDVFMSDYFFEHPLVSDVYMDPLVIDEARKRFEQYGVMGVHLGDYKNGEPYFMQPDKDGTVSARAIVNKVRWYGGIGYETSISKDKRWNIGVDLGAMFWGGEPTVMTHDGVNMTDDLVNIRGSVGDYMDLMRQLKVYPTIEFRIGYTFF